MLSAVAWRRRVLDRWLFDWRQRGVDRLPRDELEALQERRLRALLAFVVERSPFYARLYRDIDVSRAPLAELPTVDKPTLMENWDDVVTDRRLRRAEVELRRRSGGKLISYVALVEPHSLSHWCHFATQWGATWGHMARRNVVMTPSARFRR